MYINDKVSTLAPEYEISDSEKAVYSVLNELGINFERAEHDEAATIDDCLAVEKVLGVSICKNLFLCNRQKTKFYLLLMPGDKQFKTKDLSAQINSARLSFADSGAMEKYLGVAPGSVSVLGLIFDKENDVALLIDSDLLNNDFIGCHPCKNTATLKIKTEDILSKFLPYVKHEYTTVKL